MTTSKELQWLLEFDSMEVVMIDPYIKCSLCSWGTLIRVDGKRIGYDLLAQHVKGEHVDEHTLVQEGLAEIDEDIRLAEEEADGIY